jgi:DNA-directed RNA polymerase subunit RPC12/RpoP
MGHITYIEHLYHYSCSKCKKWWSIAEGTESDFIKCPHCGKRDSIEFELEDQRKKYQQKGTVQ